MWLCTFTVLTLVYNCHGKLVESHRKLSDSHTDFGLNLLHLAQTEEPGNTFLSPFSITNVLSLVYVGAEGKTKEEMAAGLGLDKHEDAMELMKNINHYLFSPDKEYKLQQANQVYADNTLPVKQTYMDDTHNYFNSSIDMVDFSLEETRIKINKFVENNTGGHIKEMLSKGDLAGAVMALINAIYFKADWNVPFSSLGVQEGADFHMTKGRKVQVDIMEMTSSFRVGKVPGVKARIIEMNYTGSEVAMYILLPDELQGLCDVQSTITAARLNQAIESLTTSHTHLQLPKFELNYSLSLSKILQTLGMQTMFTAMADFSQISDQHLQVSEALHRSFVRVHETGTEAAAATSIVMTRSRPTPAQTEFIVDHPFIFLVRERSSRAVVFMGRVVDPTDEVDDFANDQEAYRCDIHVPKLRTVSDLKGDAASGSPLIFLHVLLLTLLAALLC